MKLVLALAAYQLVDRQVMCFNASKYAVHFFLLNIILTDHFNILISLKVPYSLLQSIKHSCPISWELWSQRK